ncbi:TPA: glycosyltransferase [Salmonella enterica]|nr:glycosyltransferase [Salmonella enterica]
MVEVGVDFAIADKTAAKVAVLLSVYQNDKELPLYLSIKSILNQSYRELAMLILVDGFVSANISNLINILGKSDSRIFIIRREKNEGLASAMNTLIDFALVTYPNLEYIARMDSDDVSKLNRIELQKYFLDSNKNVDVLGGGCREFGIYNKVIYKYEFDHDIKKNIIRMTPFIHPTVMFNISIFKTGLRYPVNTVLSEDLSFWLLLCLQGYRFHNLKRVLLDYRITESTLKRRVGLAKACSEFYERFRFILIRRERCLKNAIYTLGHFIIRLMPVLIVKKLYSILR